MNTSARLAGLIGCAASGCVLGVALRAAGIRINLSPSAPVGVFLATPVQAERQSKVQLRRGMVVAVCLPVPLEEWGRARRYLMRGSCSDGTAPVGKTILAESGDTITVTADGLAVDGRLICNTRPLARDREGRPIPRMPDGRFAVGAGEMWLVSTYTTRSWDSRYFGPVPTAGVVETLRPLWTAGRGESDTATGQRSVASCSPHIR